MLVIKSIKIQFQKNIVPVRIRRANIDLKNNSFSTKRKYTQTDTHTFIWNEDITLPLYYNVPIKILFTADELEYNPEDPNTELHCMLKIIDYKATSQSGNLINLQPRHMGTVTIYYRVANQKLLLPEQKGLAVISSILAHMNHQKGNTGYIQISLGNKQIYTPTVNFVAGQLLWGQQLTIPVQQFKDRIKPTHKLLFTIFIDDEPKGQGSFLIQPLRKINIKYKKFDIVDIYNEESKLGTLFIDIIFKDRIQNQHIQLSQLENSLTNVLNRKKNSDLFIHSRQPSQNFFHPKSPLTVIKEKVPTPMRSSRSETKLLKAYNSEQTAKLLEKFEQKKSKRGYDFDAAIFKIGQYSNEDSIRRALKQRRRKEKHEGSLPKLK